MIGNFQRFVFGPVYRALLRCAISLNQSVTETESAFRAPLGNVLACLTNLYRVHCFAMTTSLIGCRPVTWTYLGHEPTPIFPGSDVDKCHSCDVDVYVAPRQRGEMKNWDKCIILCLRCAALVIRAREVDIQILDEDDPLTPQAEGS